MITDHAFWSHVHTAYVSAAREMRDPRQDHIFTAIIVDLSAGAVVEKKVLMTIYSDFLPLLGICLVAQRQVYAKSHAALAPLRRSDVGQSDQAFRLMSGMRHPPRTILSKLLTHARLQTIVSPAFGVGTMPLSGGTFMGSAIFTLQ